MNYQKNIQQQTKLKNGESSQDVSYCGSIINVIINIFKDIKDYSEERINKLSITHDKLTKGQRADREKNIIEKRLAEELKIKETKIRMRLAFDKKDGKGSKTTTKYYIENETTKFSK